LVFHRDGVAVEEVMMVQPVRSVADVSLRRRSNRKRRYNRRGLGLLADDVGPRPRRVVLDDPENLMDTLIVPKVKAGRPSHSIS
jgi:hypothetical protein